MIELHFNTVHGFNDHHKVETQHPLVSVPH